ncbi:AraC-type DNA-binding protein [Filimonas lacunae]|uniref:AraC-type DNA-binding protein n=1 Tax=Filimonas lacunae TaxID=477680 RepID=A0A173M944_9BACT|nr:helix-turn-helix domain-containing protein [Filimonas lacunae]BAV04041.1 transcriptional regulator, AraC family [Filimonas lacunae]SIT16145.1 AraC-type DNA-binding protein [Filimonas lacunae]
MSNTIDVHSIKDLTSRNLRIDYFHSLRHQPINYNKGAHKRNDHYLFIFQAKGTSKLLVDFKELKLTSPAILCILPGQVHYGISANKHTEAWFLNVSLDAVNDEYKKIFFDNYFQSRTINIEKPQTHLLVETIQLLSKVIDEQRLTILPQVMRAATDVCIGTFASFYNSSETRKQKPARTTALTKEFLQLLLNNFRTLKKITDYADLLHISAAYLNEAVKKTTGHTASYWIQQTTLNEAKRLLYNTGLSVKEIAYQLGFTDYTYFSRYFQNVEGISPTVFRDRYRDI